MSKLTNWELMRLIDCSKTTRLGMEDQGCPNCLKKLAAKGMVEKGIKGYKVTKDGIAYLAANQEDIWLLSHTYNKFKKIEEITGDDEDQI